MRKVFLDDLPHTYKGINWRECISLRINFVYDDTEDFVIIVDYLDDFDLVVEYKNKLFNITTTNFRAARLGNIIGTRSYEYKYNVGQVIDNKIQFVITKQIRLERNKNVSTTIKGYECKCLNCNSIFTKPESSIKSQGCPVCCNPPQKIVVGINDMWTTAPIMAGFLENPSDGYIFSKCSNQKTNWKCPVCNTIFNRIINDVYNQGFSCCVCNDGIPFSEKAFFDLCTQLCCLDKIKSFQKQYSPDWAKNKRYDFLITGYNKDLIVETHGSQHYQNNSFKCELKDIQTNDRLKEQLAKQNIDYPYVVLDVRESTIEWFKNSVMTSILPKYYDFTEDMIDWDEILEYTFTNLKKKTWELWNSGINDINILSQMCNLNNTTIHKYLKYGLKYNKCNYSPKITTGIGHKKGGLKNNKKVICLQTNCIYNSIKEAMAETNINNISACCRNIINYAGILEGVKLKWMYYSDYILKTKDEINEIIKLTEDVYEKRVVCLNTNNVFLSLTNASKTTGVNLACIIECCKGKQSYAGRDLISGEKLHWKYYSDWLKEHPEENLEKIS